MPCHHYYLPTQGGDSAFSIDASSVTYGSGALDEVGDCARALGCTRVALFTDPGAAPHAQRAARALSQAGVDVAVYDQVLVEPTDASMLQAARFAAAGRFTGYVSVGGGSVMDTCKAAILYATYPADFLTYVNQPLGAGQPVPGALPPHIACPTTCGTGSECTGIAVCEVTAAHVKTGIAHRSLRPARALIDPLCTHTLPAAVIAASGFDVLSHALESYTALPYTSRRRPERPSLRPMSQGANPWSDLGSMAALRLCGAYLLRAVRDASDLAAREQMMYAATLAGIAFGNAGVHLPHGMGYAVAGLSRGFHMQGYPADRPLLPHGVSVMVGAPAAFRFTASACPQRHLEAAGVLGADLRGASPEDAGELLAQHLCGMLREAGLPNGLSGVGCLPGDVPALVQGAARQARLLCNAPREVGEEALDGVFRAALSYW